MVRELLCARTSLVCASANVYVFIVINNILWLSNVCLTHSTFHVFVCFCMCLGGWKLTPARNPDKWCLPKQMEKYDYAIRIRMHNATLCIENRSSYSHNAHTSARPRSWLFISSHFRCVRVCVMWSSFCYGTTYIEMEWNGREGNRMDWIGLVGNTFVHSQNDFNIAMKLIGRD